MSEDEIAEFEANRNEAQERYFNARPYLEATDEEISLFDAGFRMAWEHLNS